MSELIIITHSQLRIWWLDDQICLEAFDYDEPTIQLAFLLSSHFTAPQRGFRVQVEGLRYHNFSINLIPCPPQVQKFLIAIVGYSHGQNYLRSDGVRAGGGRARSDSCSPEIGILSEYRSSTRDHLLPESAAP